MSKKMTISPLQNKEEADPSKIFGGSDFDCFNTMAANQAANGLWLANTSDEDRDKLLQGAMVALKGIAPQDEMEGMLAVQMLACHSAAMECFRRSMIEGQSFAGRQEALNQANKLTRSYTNLMDALNKKRGKGGQKVTIKHVHVHEGGQAIVGNVENTPKPIPGAGGNQKTTEQPHAKQK